MLRPSTTFVLGAAFSADLGLPLGEGLKLKLVEVLPKNHGEGGNEKLRWLLGQHGNPEWFDASRTLRAALPYAASIDNLVEHHQHDHVLVQVAKWSIACAIALEEQRSAIGSKPAGRALEAGNSSVYHQLFRLIVAGVSRRNLDEAFKRLQVITFNYDRTLEAFLVRALAAHSGLSTEAAEEVVSHATILHAYGALGQDENGNAPRQFTEVQSSDGIEQLARGIRTFSEKVQSGESDLLRHIVRDSERLIFLGCAYHKQNLNLIAPQAQLLADEVYGTVYVPPPADPDHHAAPDLEMFSMPANAALRSTLLHWRQPFSSEETRLFLQPMTCRQLIAQHGINWIEGGGEV
ncbi:hypothetical protein [Brevundimonas sp. Leaf168]|uniref:hypothetical protein n=1 Tax=Brevundimonas sp. Leaf168 TaxID=1736283 RepID=UPI000A42D879|nr:hypothetical protein [Brevundimonas sp. Leaf168]